MQRTMQRTMKFFSALALAGLALAPRCGWADWTSAYRDATNNALTPVAAAVTDPAAQATWSTGASQLYSGGGIAVVGGTVYVTAQTGGDTFSDPSDDKISVKALSAKTGGLYWESPALDLGNAVAFNTCSSPTIDPSDGAVYIGTGSAVQKLDPRSGQVLATRVLSAANTQPGLSDYEIINTNPVVAGDKVIIETYGGMDPTAKQLVALNKSDLTVAWFKNDGGIGTGTPAYDAATGRVYTATTKGIACYLVADGTAVWNSATLSAPWTANRDIYGSLVLAGGTLYATTYGFDGVGEVLAIDPATGALKWRKDALASNLPPLVLSGTVYVQGCVWGLPARLMAYKASDGAAVFDVETGGSSYQTPMAATSDRIYMTDYDYSAGSLLVIDPASGTVLSKVDGSFNGGLAIDALGGLYAHDGDALRAFGQTVPVTLSAFTVE